MIKKVCMAPMLALFLLIAATGLLGTGPGYANPSSSQKGLLTAQSSQNLEQKFTRYAFQGNGSCQEGPSPSSSGRSGSSGVSSSLNSSEPSELSYFNARYYDCETGQFSSPDPVVNALDPSDGNQNLGFHGNPLRYQDPSGATEIPSGYQPEGHKPEVESPGHARLRAMASYGEHYGQVSDYEAWGTFADILTFLSLAAGPEAPAVVHFGLSAGSLYALTKSAPPLKAGETPQLMPPVLAMGTVNGGPLTQEIYGRTRYRPGKAESIEVPGRPGVVAFGEKGKWVFEVLKESDLDDIISLQEKGWLPEDTFSYFTHSDKPMVTQEELTTTISTLNAAEAFLQPEIMICGCFAGNNQLAKEVSVHSPYSTKNIVAPTGLGWVARGPGDLPAGSSFSQAWNVFSGGKIIGVGFGWYKGKEWVVVPAVQPP